jgi:sterol desaturase/sphingolipid hydroxylase (fatty acid hydroxylase superfamily)
MIIVLFREWARLLPLLWALPPELQDPGLLDARVAQMRKRGASRATIVVDPEVPAAYNRGVTRLAAAMRSDAAALHSDAWPFRWRMLLYLAVRFAAAAALLFGPATSMTPPAVGLVLAFVAAAQLALLPRSVFTAVTTLVALGPALFVGPVLVQLGLRWALAAAASLDGGSPFSTMINAATVPVNAPFIAAFVALDLVLSAVLCVWIPGHGAPRPVALRTVGWSAVIGTANSKSYHLLLLGAMARTAGTVGLAAWAIDAALGLSARVCALVNRHRAHWAVLFYHQHRLAHLPRVYADAHKFHHVETRTTAFDAHLYGSGAPEELACLVLELAVTVLGGAVPPFLTSHLLYQSYTNKVGHTERCGSGAAEPVDTSGKDAHIGHHRVALRNFGIFNQGLDLALGTCLDRERHTAPGGVVLRAVRDTAGRVTAIEIHEAGEDETPKKIA